MFSKYTVYVYIKDVVVQQVVWLELVGLVFVILLSMWSEYNLE